MFLEDAILSQKDHTAVSKWLNHREVLLFNFHKIKNVSLNQKNNAQIHKLKSTILAKYKD